VYLRTNVGDTQVWFFLILFSLNSYSYPKAQSISDSKVLRPDRTIGFKEGDKFVLNQPHRVRYNEYDNLVYVVDRKDNDIKVF